MAVEQLQDYGEKIGGAKKDLAAQLAAVTGADIAAKPLSKTFPEPDYKKLVDSGIITADGAIFLRFFYEQIPPKPRQPYKLKNWTVTVENAIQVFREVLSNEGTKYTDFAERMKQNTSYTGIILFKKYELYYKTLKALDFPNSNFKLGNYSIAKAGGMITANGQPVPPELRDSYYQVISGYSVIGYYPSFELAVEKLKELLDTKKNTKTTGTKFEFYQDRRKGDFFIGKKAALGVVHVKDGFSSLKVMRDWYKENAAQVQAIWDEMKIQPEERPESNAPRIGKDWRNGENITSEKFAKTFGFRGVEFGNWVNLSERQTHVNDGFDALMDLASVLNFSPLALSLNGELGFAFGARGSGKFSAHYEPTKVVINLTKTRGAGSLAHEWWHALDNYFSRERGNKDAYLTQLPIAKLNKDFSQDLSIPLEIISGFKGVVDSINSTKLLYRSMKLDEARSDAYWSTIIEMSARSFENFVIETLGAAGLQNDYLANFRDTGAWIENALKRGNMPDPLYNYPYPLKDESPVINAAYKNLFEIINSAGSEKLLKTETTIAA